MKLKVFLSFFISLFFSCSLTNASGLEYITKFENWEIYKEKKQNGKEECHAVISPFKTRAFNGIREIPFLAYSFKGSKQYTLSISPGFVLDGNKKVSVNIGKKSFDLKNGNKNTAWTYSAVQDISIYSHLLLGNNVFLVRSYSKTGDTALDYYNNEGLIDAIHYMESNCN